MNVSLTPQLESFVNQKVASGRYASASEVVLEALRLLEEQDQKQASSLEALRREVNVGVDQLDRRESRPFDAAEVKSLGRKRQAPRRRE